MAKTQEITVTKYNINRCGYYKPYAKNNPHLFGNVSETLKHLMSWSTGKNLSQTKTYEKTEENLPTYLFDIFTRKGDYLICTWNESYAGNGQVLSVPGTAPVGTKKVEGIDLKEGNIAGYPTYFWFRPSKEQFLTIQTNGSMNGRLNLNLYLESFIKKFDKNYVKSIKNVNADEDDEDDAHNNVQGYIDPANGKQYSLEDASAAFESSLVRLEGGTQSEILDNLSKIFKIIRKESINTSIENKTSIISKMLTGIGVKELEGHSTSYTYKIKYEVDFTPSKKELLQIVDNWSPEKKDTWDDVGFKIRGKSSPIWLSSEIDRQKIELSIEQTEEGLMDLPSLIAELQDKLKD